MYAASEGLTEVVQVLLSAPLIDVDIVGMGGSTALRLAAGFLDIVQAIDAFRRNRSN